MKKITGILTFCALALSIAHAAPIDDAEQALQARDFEAAVGHLEKAEAGDYPSYLKAVALYLGEKLVHLPCLLQSSCSSRCPIARYRKICSACCHIP